MDIIEPHTNESTCLTAREDDIKVIDGASQAHPVSECGHPEERGVKAFANLGSRGSAPGRRRHVFSP
ncbi:hypothetical protein DSLASN_12010 [Desulfoluna limicola]|uniref:Uncharacterized protein n=1 Tax=Desulfoluna limicola TaxID=2810562 RepID=A0ABM7PD53_9BACT|nr:hypothetical protein DSLASN_12010 [Desulfoluna limicola]